MQHFSKLRASGQARVVIRAAYAFTSTFPADERFVLVAQLRRAAISVGLNIAEGCSRDSTREFIRYLEIARGSGMELEFAVLVTEDLSLGKPDKRELLRQELLTGQRQLS